MPRAALPLIDIQQGFKGPAHWGTERSTPTFEANIERLLIAFRSAPDSHVLHSKFMEYATPLPSERIFPKTTNSPFIETDLEKVIKDLDIELLVVAGLMTAHCVSTTLRLASNLRVVNHPYGCIVRNEGEGPQGELILVCDGTATFNVSFEGKEYDAENVHAVHLATMKDEFSSVKTTEETIKALLA